MTFRAAVLTSLVLVLLACGSTQKPAPVAEAPIDQVGGGGSTGSTGSGDDPGSTGGTDTSGGGATTGTTAVPDKPPPPGVGPQPMGGGSDAPPDAGGGAAPAGSSVKKGPLTPKECADVVNKLVTMMAVENHMPAPALDGQAGQLGDLFSGMRNECAQNTTRKQYTCAMAARTTEVWKKCMQ